MTLEESDKVKIDLLWELIEEFQDARKEEGCDIDEAVLTYNDIEIALYEKIEQVDPKNKNK